MRTTTTFSSLVVLLESQHSTETLRRLYGVRHPLQSILRARPHHKLKQHMARQRLLTSLSRIMLLLPPSSQQLSLSSWPLHFTALRTLTSFSSAAIRPATACVSARLRPQSVTVARLHHPSLPIGRTPTPRHAIAIHLVGLLRTRRLHSVLRYSPYFISP